MRPTVLRRSSCISAVNGLVPLQLSILALRSLLEAPWEPSWLRTSTDTTELHSHSTKVKEGCQLKTWNGSIQLKLSLTLLSLSKQLTQTWPRSINGWLLEAVTQEHSLRGSDLSTQLTWPLPGLHLVSSTQLKILCNTIKTSTNQPTCNLIASTT